jgi:hypothetical protein
MRGRLTTADDVWRPDWCGVYQRNLAQKVAELEEEDAKLALQEQAARQAGGTPRALLYRLPGLRTAPHPLVPSALQFATQDLREPPRRECSTLSCCSWLPAGYAPTNLADAVRWAPGLARGFADCVRA